MFVMKVITVDHTVALEKPTVGATPALGKPGADVSLIDSPRTKPDGVFDKLPLWRLPPLLPPLPLPLETVPVRLPLVEVSPETLSLMSPVVCDTPDVSEDSVPVTSEACTVITPVIATTSAIPMYKKLYSTLLVGIVLVIGL